MAGTKPTMFIGSSVEGKRIAESIQEQLEYDVDSTVWHQGIFGLSGGTLETLVNCVNDFDFATLVLTSDDLIEKRNINGRSPRDNVLFELGLFMGALGRSRTFIVHSRSNPPLLPSDLAGITPATYVERDNLSAALGPACTKLRRVIEVQGARDRSEATIAHLPDISHLNQILSEQHSMITEMFKRLMDGSRADARSARKDGMEFLDGAWVSSSGSHGYCRIEPEGPRLIYRRREHDSATGEYYDFKRIGEEIFGRFRWFDRDIRGFVWLKIESHALLSGAWWLERDVPATAHDDPELLKRARGMNSNTWTKQLTTEPAWATVAFHRRSSIAENIMKEAKLIFGVRTSGSVSLSVTVNGQLPAQPPDLLITTNGQKDLVIPCSNNTWVTTLGDGDHVVRMPVSVDSWFLDPVTFTFSAPVTIVIPGHTTSSPLVTWTATTGAANDPKNPWPPPLIGQIDPGPLADATWLGGTLTTLGAGRCRRTAGD